MAEEIKIAFLNLSFGKVNRGAETFVLEISQRLRKSGHQVDIFTDRKNYAVRWSILWRIFCDPPGLQVLFFTLRKLPILWREKYDVVVPIDGGWQPALVRLITWLYGGKMVISGQSGRGWDDRNNLWCFPDVFVALSHEARAWAKKVNPLVRPVYIPNGVDLEKFKPQGKTYNANLTRPIILCAGALTPDKRIDLAIKAVARLRQASLLVVGNGPLKDELTKLGKKLLDGRFNLFPAPFAQMPEIYRAADLFTLPSTPAHSFEIVLVEAMASGLGVVANADPIRQEIVGDVGILVNPEDLTAYAQALNEALRVKWGTGPREQAKKFDWDIIAKEYERLFLKLCSRK